MNIKVLGTGCSNCNTLVKLVKTTVEEMGVDATVEKVEDIQKIMGYGIMRTPGLVINEKVVISGRIPSAKELVELIEKNR